MHLPGKLGLPLLETEFQEQGRYQTEFGNEFQFTAERAEIARVFPIKSQQPLRSLR